MAVEQTVKAKGVVGILTLLLTLVVMLYLTERGWNAIEGWGIVLAINLITGILTDAVGK